MDTLGRETRHTSYCKCVLKWANQPTRIFFTYLTINMCLFQEIVLKTPYLDFHTIWHQIYGQATVGQEFSADLIFFKDFWKTAKISCPRMRFLSFICIENIVNCQHLGPNPQKYHVRELEFSAIRENFLSYSNWSTE